MVGLVDGLGKRGEGGKELTKNVIPGANAKGSPEGGANAALLENARGKGGGFGEEDLNCTECDEEDTSEAEKEDDAPVGPLCARD